MAYRAWCFTAYILPTPTEFKHYIYGREICPDTQRVHWQGSIYFENRIRLATVQARIGVPGVHCEPAKDYTASIAYCSKDGQTTEEGTRPEQGKRSDLIAVYTDIKEGKTLTEIVEEHPTEFIKYHNGIERAITALQPRRDWKTVVIVLWGPSGSGKTRRAVEQLGASIINFVGGRFIQNYHNEPCVCLDDYDGRIPRDTFLQMLDRYAMTIDIKGGEAIWNPKILIITSNNPPCQWYPGDYAPIRRRLSHVIELANP